MSATKVQKGIYKYKGYTLSNCDYHAPDKCIWWEAVNDWTGCADYHANTKKELMDMIDEEEKND